MVEQKGAHQKGSNKRNEILTNVLNTTDSVVVASRVVESVLFKFQGGGTKVDVRDVKWLCDPPKT